MVDKREHKVDDEVLYDNFGKEFIPTNEVYKIVEIDKRAGYLIGNDDTKPFHAQEYQVKAYTKPLKDLNGILPLCADSKCFVEEGTIGLVVEDTPIHFTLQQISYPMSDNINIYLLDHSTPENIKLLKEYGAEFEDGSDEKLVENNFTELIWDVYQNTIDTQFGNWSCEGFDELADKYY